MTRPGPAFPRRSCRDRRNPRSGRTSWVDSAQQAAISRSRTCRSASSRSAKRPAPAGRRDRRLSSSTSPAIADLLDEDWRDDLSQPVLNAWLARGPEAPARASRRACRELLTDERYRDDVEPQLIGQSEVRMHVPCLIGDYTDFYVGIHHATNVGKQFRPDNPLLPNYKYVPIGYHGRASSVRAVGRAGDPAQRPAQAARRRRARIWPEPPPRLRARARHLWIGRGNELGLADPDRRGERAYRRLLPAQRLVGARPAGVGISAARAVPRQEFPDQRLARGSSARGAGAVPQADAAAARRAIPQPLALSRRSRGPAEAARSASSSKSR